eukprot:CAMPEP_0115057200 /NCGR_PEP_ID=MMETSP0227-20121206/5624_1 /TAXON_ID=89957 /ORGANISM="Polarella glacialis, Strain CCMP 1383" /LENGTH=108 /DNA_ID=CAMNT_0002441973 /DNA_START=88 /DNA_END=410 /DNA_ORIENTATION=-
MGLNAAAVAEANDRFYGVVAEAKGQKFWVSCEGLPAEYADRPPKITRKSEPPAGLTVGSWITFTLVDEWPGENWGSLLVQDIRFADAPEGADEDVIAALLLSEEQAPA